MISGLTIKKRRDGWWIEGVEPFTVDGETFDTYGPYDTRAAARSDRDGVIRFYKHEGSKHGT